LAKYDKPYLDSNIHFNIVYLKQVNYYYNTNKIILFNEQGEILKIIPLSNTL